jgi:hypothetical protein
MTRMHSFTPMAGLFLIIASAAQAEITFAGGDGATPATAVIIEGATGSSDGVKAEYDWIAQNRPGATFVSQTLMLDGNRVFDAMLLQSGGKTEEIYVDITGFYGNF